MIEKVRIIVADDHAVVRKGVRDILTEVPGFTVVAECADGDAVLRAIAEIAADVVVLDVDMPGKDGFAVLRALKDTTPRPEFVLMTMHGREDLLRGAFDLGAKGYVAKGGSLLDVIDAIRAVRAGQPYISSSLSASLLTKKADPVSLDALTPAERRVLRLIADFKSSKEIADELGIHYRTVENHRTAIAGKLGLTGSHALVRFAALHRDRLI
ncbi:MAG TPA: response regulator transcription factor [Candidatus Polarisedimenticolaceae bacterium]|nr:response regulator transcription factor [Candidatus Polarisedimenticolaceae bacterium]